jgi:hypothetical protein
MSTAGAAAPVAHSGGELPDQRRWHESARARCPPVPKTQDQPVLHAALRTPDNRIWWNDSIASWSGNGPTSKPRCKPAVGALVSSPVSPRSTTIISRTPYMLARTPCRLPLSNEQRSVVLRNLGRVKKRFPSLFRHILNQLLPRHPADIHCAGPPAPDPAA